MNLSKKHRILEKKHGCSKNSLREPVAYILNKKLNLDEIEKGCEEYCLLHGNKFEVAFNLYVSCIKDQTVKHSKFYWLKKNLERKIFNKN